MEQHCFGRILSPAVFCTHGVLYYDQLLFTLRFDTQKIKENSGDNDAEWLNGRDSRDGQIVVYSYSVRVVFRLSDQSRSPRRDTLKDFTAKMGGGEGGRIIIVIGDIPDRYYLRYVIYCTCKNTELFA